MFGSQQAYFVFFFVSKFAARTMTCLLCLPVRTVERCAPSVRDSARNAGAEFDSPRQKFSLADRCYKVFNLWMLQKQPLETLHFHKPLWMTLRYFYFGLLVCWGIYFCCRFCSKLSQSTTPWALLLVQKDWWAGLMRVPLITVHVGGVKIYKS